MIRHHLRFIVVFTTLAVTPAASAQPAAPDDRRVVRLEQWLNAVFEHDPGSADQAASFIALWPGRDLETLLVDANVLARLMRNPSLSRFTVGGGPGGRPRSVEIQYSRGQLDRMKLLARMLGCGAGDRTPRCLEIAQIAATDPDLRPLLTVVRAQPANDGDNGVLRRGALLHTDIITRVPRSARSVDDRPVTVETVRIEFADGQQRSLSASPVHLTIARMLLDAVKPIDAERPEPGRDDMVRLWYHATSAWLQANEQHEPEHLDHARRLFPNDPLFMFFSGALHETWAGKEVQTLVRGVVLPSGITVGVKSDRGELHDAEGFFRRALERAPDMAEARLRLGHTLLGLERYEDAAAELRRVPVDDPLLQYYASLFLGAAEESLRKFAEASESYSRAAALYPTAQSPRIALSALARRRGDRDGAWRAIQQVFGLPATEPERDDPWWSYLKQQGRHAERLLADVCRPFELENSR